MPTDVLEIWTIFLGAIYNTIMCVCLLYSELARAIGYYCLLSLYSMRQLLHVHMKHYMIGTPLVSSQSFILVYSGIRFVSIHGLLYL